MQEVDYAAIAMDVYALAGTEDPLAAPVKEALDVIDEAFETWGCVDSTLLYPVNLIVSAGRSMSP